MTATDGRMLVASGDGHVGIPTERYRDYLEREHHEAFDEFLSMHRYRWTPTSRDAVLSPTVFDWMKGNERYESGGMASVQDPARRLHELDLDGIAVEMAFPDDQQHNTPPWLVGLAPAGMDLVCVPAFADVQIDGEDRTAIKLIVSPR